MPNSRWPLLLDIASANVLVWVASFGRDVELTPDAHRYFFDRYSRLAAVHRARGNVARAERVQAKADAHRGHEFDGDPPFAAAMAMPRPRHFVYTDAVSRRRLDEPDDAA